MYVNTVIKITVKKKYSQPACCCHIVKLRTFKYPLKAAVSLRQALCQATVALHHPHQGGYVSVHEGHPPGVLCQDIGSLQHRHKNCFGSLLKNLKCDGLHQVVFPGDAPEYLTHEPCER